MIRRKPWFFTCVLLAALWGPLACARAAKSGEVLQRYQAAMCVSPLIDSSAIEPLSGEWDALVWRQNGSSFSVSGSQGIGGALTVGFGRGVEIQVAGSADEYLKDVRFDEARDLLYVKTSGQGAANSEETWLLEYDLAARRQMVKVQLDPKLLPPECPPESRRRR